MYVLTPFLKSMTECISTESYKYSQNVLIFDKPAKVPCNFIIQRTRILKRKEGEGKLPDDYILDKISLRATTMFS
jgi:hypothetical protein